MSPFAAAILSTLLTILLVCLIGLYLAWRM
ncbi:hypothetical protein HD884_002153 [Ochrobactrum intermedium]|nr:hypothetical protein [Brucella intermedia]